MNIIHKHIRKICIKNIIFGIIPLIICMIPLLILPFHEIFYPEQVSSIAGISDVYSNGDKYVQITFPTLNYTGYNLVSGNSVDGSYYYYIEDGHAIFVLINTNSKKPKHVLNNYTCIGVLCDWDKNLRTTLHDYAADIGFSPTGLTSVTSDVMLDETRYNLKFYTYAFIYIICTAVILGIFVLINLTIYAIPELNHSMDKFRHLSHRAHLHGVLQELNTSRVHSGRTYLTTHYLVSLPASDAIVIPYDKILWAYEHSHIHRILWFKLRTTYTIHFVCRHHIHFTAFGYSKEELDTIMNYINEHFPDILTGYSRENKHIVSKLTGKKFRQRK